MGKYVVVDRNGNVYREFDTEREKEEWLRKENEKYDRIGEGLYEATRFLNNFYLKSSVMSALLDASDKLFKRR